MRIPIQCMACARDDAGVSRKDFFAELQENGLYYLTCPSGHKTVTCLQEQKFEVLFDMGIHAILDGYYREAVSAFVAALERFQEFYISVVCNKNGVSKDAFEKSWKIVSNQSERQFGAYVFFYLSENGRPPTLLRDKSIAFRNSVIHKGRIPSKDEAIDFGKEILTLIYPILAALKKDLSESVQHIVAMHVEKTRSQVAGDPKIQFMSMATTISIAGLEIDVDKAFAKSLVQYSADRRRRH